MSEIFIVAEEPPAQKDTIELQFGADNLDKKDTFGKSDPYFTLSKQTAGGKFVEIYNSEVIKNTLNPVWWVLSFHTFIFWGKRPVDFMSPWACKMYN